MYSNSLSFCYHLSSTELLCSSLCTSEFVDVYVSVLNVFFFF